MPVPSVLEAAIDALLAGSSAWLKIPAGGNLRCDWLTTKGCYRLTVDVALARELADVELVAISIAELRSTIEAELGRRRG